MESTNNTAVYDGNQVVAAARVLTEIAKEGADHGLTRILWVLGGTASSDDRDSGCLLFGIVAEPRSATPESDFGEWKEFLTRLAGQPDSEELPRMWEEVIEASASWQHYRGVRLVIAGEWPLD